jgi:hypothetical protein
MVDSFLYGSNSTMNIYYASGRCNTSAASPILGTRSTYFELNTFRKDKLLTDAKIPTTAVTFFEVDTTRDPAQHVNIEQGTENIFG